MFANRGAMLENLHKYLVKSSNSTEGIANLFPIEKAITCCGATIDTAFKYKQYCTGSLANAVNNFINSKFYYIITWEQYKNYC